MIFEVFKRGLEGALGPPKSSAESEQLRQILRLIRGHAIDVPTLLGQIEKEHCSQPDSAVPFPAQDGEEKVLPKAKRDVLREILEKLKVDPECQAHFKEFEKIYSPRRGERGLRKMFEDKAYETRAGIQKFGVHTITLDTLTIWRRR